MILQKNFPVLCSNALIYICLSIGKIELLTLNSDKSIIQVEKHVFYIKHDVFEALCDIQVCRFCVKK